MHVLTVFCSIHLFCLLALLFVRTQLTTNVFNTRSFLEAELGAHCDNHVVNKHPGYVKLLFSELLLCVSAHVAHRWLTGGCALPVVRQWQLCVQFVFYAVIGKQQYTGENM